MNDIPHYHASPVEAAQIAHDSEVRELILYHLIPPLRSALLHPYYLEGVSDEFSGRVTLAEDGLVVRLHADSDDIEYEILDF